MRTIPYWHGKRGLITGGSSGLGRAIAEASVLRGMEVTLVARDAARLADAAEQLKSLEQEAVVRTLVADLSEPGEAARVATEGEPFDFVCHAAGHSSRGRLVETSREEFQRLLDLNFLAAAELATAAGQPLAERHGHLVLIGSLATRVAPAWLGAYAASKHPLGALAQQLRLELGPEGLHTLLVCSGPLARIDAGHRYDAVSKTLPESARQPGGGARVRAIDPASLAAAILDACQSRRTELVVPRKARLLFALTALFPTWGDWLLSRSMGKSS